MRYNTEKEDSRQGKDELRNGSQGGEYSTEGWNTDWELNCRLGLPKVADFHIMVIPTFIGMFDRRVKF